MGALIEDGKEGIGIVIGCLFMLAGASSNRLVYALNSGMPFPSVGSVIPPVPHNGKIPIWEGTRLVWLSDVIPWFNGTWISAGDLLMVVGLATFGVAAILYMTRMLRERRYVGRALPGKTRKSRFE